MVLRGWRQWLDDSEQRRQQAKAQQARRAFVGRYFVSWQTYVKHMRIARSWIRSASPNAPMLETN